LILPDLQRGENNAGSHRDGIDQIGDVGDVHVPFSADESRV
jgi:hypothetical protein